LKREKSKNPKALEGEEGDNLFYFGRSLRGKQCRYGYRYVQKVSHPKKTTAR